MFPGRFWMAPGSGEYMNEHITGQAWPPKETRQRRLEECVDIIRRLHAGDVVTHHGLVTVEQARIWDVPETKPPIIAPAVSVETARRAAAWADGLVTVNQPPGKLKDMLAAVPDAGGRGKPAALQVHLSWAPTEAEAVAIAEDQWRTNVFAPPIPWDLPTAAHFDGVSAGRPARTRCGRPSTSPPMPGGTPQWLAADLPTSGSMSCTCTLSARSRRRSSRPSPSTSSRSSAVT